MGKKSATHLVFILDWCYFILFICFGAVSKQNLKILLKPIYLVRIV